MSRNPRARARGNRGKTHHQRHCCCRTTASINSAPSTRVGPGTSGPAVLRLEILLDRTHFSRGEVDGRYGQDLKNAIETYQWANQLGVDGVAGPSVWRLLNQDSADAVIEHTISAENIAGPFDENILTDWVARSKLKGMYYALPLQEFTGKYDATEALLRRLNRRPRWFVPPNAPFRPLAMSACPRFP
jgi:hypothetical protein